MATPVFKAARYLYDIDTAEERYLNIDSTKNTLKLQSTYSGSKSTTAPAYWTSLTITHNLGYQPYVEVYFQEDGDTTWKKGPYLEYNTSTNAIEREISLIRDSSDQMTVYFVSGDPTVGSGDAITFNYLVKLYVNAWEGIWYE
jgi:hypothetical protein